MYPAFDGFLKTDTWHTTHPEDERRFFLALDGVVKDPGFNPGEMGEYMRQKTSPGAGRDGHPYATTIDRYVDAAWAVKGYLAAISG